MPSITLPTASVHYTEHGQGTPLVLLHANPGDSQDFEAVIPAFAKTYRVLALDWPGYGRSAPPQQPESVGVLFFNQVLREFLAALALPPAFFMGNSLGGNVAARLAAESPERVRGLVLVAPGGFTTPGLVSRVFCKLQASRLSLPPRWFARLYLKHRTATTRAMLELASTTQAAAPQIMLNRAVWRSFAAPDSDLRTVAPKIKAPTLLLFGKSDPVIPASRDGKVAAQCMPSAQFRDLPCGHAPFAEVPELFLQEAQPFLAACGDPHSMRADAASRRGSVQASD
jgi:pimeloyl-ACP methyl ester carboxylesterase